MSEGMTVNELIDVLKTKDGDMRVVVDGYEYGFCDLAPEQVYAVEIALDVNDPPDNGGPHDELSGRVTEGLVIVTAILLSRVE